MRVYRRLAAEQADQPCLPRRAGQQIAAPHDAPDAHGGVVKADGELVSEHTVGAADDEIAVVAREIAGDGAVMRVADRDVQIRHAQLPCRPAAGLLQRAALALREMRAAAAGIVLRFAGVRRGGRQTLGAAAPAGIDQALLRQKREGVLVKRGAPALGEGRIGVAEIPVKTQPAQIVRDGRGVDRVGAGGIEILHAEDQFAAQTARVQPCQQHGKQVAHMHIARGAGGEAPRV